MFNYICIATRQLKARTVEEEEAAIARQWYSKHASAATDYDTSSEGTVFFVQSLPRLYSK
jgi:hypothetical protein